MTDKVEKTSKAAETAVRQPTRRQALKTLGMGAGAAVTMPLWSRYAQAQSSEPIRIGFGKHATGIGAAYGRWYDRTSQAAIAKINAEGGVNGRMLELVTEDDGTDPRRAAEVLEKFANQSNCDVAFGTLFSHVVVGAAPAAAELKLPYFVVSEGHHVASGMLNRWTLQPGISDVKSQISAMAPFISNTLGKKVTMIYPDYAFGYDHRDNLAPAIEAAGGEVVAQIAIPPTETSFTKYFPKIPRDTEVIYHVMIGPAVLTFVKEMGEFFGPSSPEIFGFVDSIEAVDLNSPGLEFLDGSYFWEGSPRYLQPGAPDYVTAYRDAVGLDENGASVTDPTDVSTAAHMYGCWETLHVIKDGMEACGYSGPGDRQALIEAVEAMGEMPAGAAHPQGAKIFNGKTHQAFAPQYISQVKDGKLVVVETVEAADTLYPDEVDYTTMDF